MSSSVGAPVLSLDRVATKVGGRTVWSQVSLQVGAGEFVAVLGPNGVGKSTLLKVILGLQPVSAGRAAGARRPGRAAQRADRLPAAAARVRPGHPGPWRGHRAAGLGRRPVGHPAARAARRAAAPAPPATGSREVIDLVGATGYAQRPIGQCSGGEQQRLLIAQALIRRPELLMLDEPLDSLDVTNQAAVSALVQRICRTENVAVLLVAHDVNPILPYLDQVIYLAHGGAVMGPPEQVITADTLSMLYGTPIDVLRDRTGRLVVVGQPDDAHPEHRAVR